MFGRYRRTPAIVSDPALLNSPQLMIDPQDPNDPLGDGYGPDGSPYYEPESGYAGENDDVEDILRFAREGDNRGFLAIARRMHRGFHEDQDRMDAYRSSGLTIIGNLDDDGEDLNPGDLIEDIRARGARPVYHLGAGALPLPAGYKGLPVTTHRWFRDAEAQDIARRIWALTWKLQNNPASRRYIKIRAQAGKTAADAWLKSQPSDPKAMAVLAELYNAENYESGLFGRLGNLFPARVTKQELGIFMAAMSRAFPDVNYNFYSYERKTRDGVTSSDVFEWKDPDLRDDDDAGGALFGEDWNTGNALEDAILHHGARPYRLGVMGAGDDDDVLARLMEVASFFGKNPRPISIIKGEPAVYFYAPANPEDREAIRDHLRSALRAYVSRFKLPGTFVIEASALENEYILMPRIPIEWASNLIAMYSNEPNPEFFIYPSVRGVDDAGAPEGEEPVEAALSIFYTAKGKLRSRHGVKRAAARNAVADRKALKSIERQSKRLARDTQKAADDMADVTFPGEEEGASGFRKYGDTIITNPAFLTSAQDFYGSNLGDPFDTSEGFRKYGDTIITNPAFLNSAQDFYGSNLGDPFDTSEGMDDGDAPEVFENDDAQGIYEGIWDTAAEIQSTYGSFSEFYTRGEDDRAVQLYGALQLGLSRLASWANRGAIRRSSITEAVEYLNSAFPGADIDLATGKGGAVRRRLLGPPKSGGLLKYGSAVITNPAFMTSAQDMYGPDLGDPRDTAEGLTIIGNVRR